LDKTAHGRGFAAIVDAGTVLMALPSTSEFIVYKPDGKEYSEIARIKAADTETYAYRWLQETGFSSGTGTR